MDPKTPDRSARGSTTPLPRPNGPAASVRPGASPTARLGSNPLISGARSTGSDPQPLGSGILVLARWIQTVVIGIWLGAILTVGALVAPRAFATFKTPAEAGHFIGPLFQRVTEAGGICGVIYLVMLLIHDPLWRRYHHTSTGQILSLLKTVLAAGMVGAAGYLLYRVTPTMEGYQQAAHLVHGHLAGGAGRAFDQWHKIYEKITYGIFTAGLALMLLTQMSRRRK